MKVSQIMARRRVSREMSQGRFSKYEILPQNFPRNSGCQDSNQRYNPRGTRTPTHPHTPTHPPTETQEKPTRRREAKQAAKEQAPPGQGHQRRNLDIQSPSAVTITVPAPTTGSHPKKVSEETDCSHSKSRASGNSGTTSSSVEEGL